MKCFIPFIGCRSRIWGAPNSIYTPLIVHSVLFLMRPTLKLHTKYPIYGYPVSMGSGMLCYKDRHPLLLKWFITFLR